MVQPRLSTLTLAQQAQRDDLLLNDLAQRDFNNLPRVNQFTGKMKTSVQTIARNAHERYFRRYQMEVARNPSLIH